ncbi:hypothetical protein [Lysinibacillus capsici]|uniref:hypothetical protein n=1 Tax=Lysinibacillus capsici TaxID=2115968 RepID=UPI0027A9EF6F|nr:hypothetical protein QIX46_05860 [Lysinibacillus boronitolerans]
MFIKRLFTLWFLLLSIVCGAFFFLANAPIQYAEKNNVSMSQPNNDELLRYIQQYQFLISEISYTLRKESYSFLLDYGILPNGKIELLVSLPDKVDRQTKQHIEETMLDVIKANELNPISFQITLKQLYEPAETISTRLSYNDVMANLFEAMFTQDFGTFSVDHSMTSEKIQVRINLTEKKNDKVKKKAQQLAKDTIMQHQFDVEAFSIEVQNQIKVLD